MLPFKGYKLGHVFVTAYVIGRIHDGMYDLVLRSWVQGFFDAMQFCKSTFEPNFMSRKNQILQI